MSRAELVKGFTEARAAAIRYVAETEKPIKPT